MQQQLPSVCTAILCDSHDASFNCRVLCSAAEHAFKTF